MLLENGVIVDTKDQQGQTVLHLAAQRGQAVSAQLLLEKKANANIQDTTGLTALHWAAKHGQGTVARLLLKHEAMVNIKGDRGETALNFAASHRFVTVVQLLLANGAGQEKGPAGVTALRSTVLYGREDIARVLLEHGTKKRFWDEALCMAKTETMKQLLLEYEPGAERVECRN